MTQRRTRKDRREARERQASRRRIVGAGAAGLLVLLIAAFVFLRGEDSEGVVAEEAPELPSAPQVGALAPDFELVSNKGEAVRLSDFRGQAVAVNFMHTW